MNNSQVPQENNSEIRRGLVLEGGGAKGAWQFGALKALHDKGIKFDYVAGTSVGALNGALWAAGCLKLGEELWGSLSLSKVYKLRLHHSPMFFIGLFARIFSAYVRGFISPKISPEMSALYPRIILYSLTIVPTIVAAIYLLLMVIHFFSTLTAKWSGGVIGMWLCHIPMTVLAITFLLMAFVESLRSGSARGRYFFISSILASGGLFIHLFFYVLTVKFDSSKGGLEAVVGFVVNPALQMPIFLWILGVIPLVIFCIGILLRRLNISIFNVAPLEAIIKKLLDSKFKMPMFATVAREINEYFDPDDLKYRYNLNKDVSTAIPRSTIMPMYLRVDNLSPDDALITLLATSALPLGITPARKAGHVVDPSELSAVLEAEAELTSKFSLSVEGSHTQKASLIDGGVVDNTPWYPFIEDFPCDEIYIVCCNPPKDLDDSTMKEKWKRINRLLRVVKASLQYDDRHDKGFDTESGTFTEATYIIDENGSIRPVKHDKSDIFARTKPGAAKDIKNKPPIEIPLRETNRWSKTRVVIIAPDAKLGNFLTGTLNFSTNVARKRVAEGYQKASSIIKEKRK